MGKHWASKKASCLSLFQNLFAFTSSASIILFADEGRASPLSDCRRGSTATSEHTSLRTSYQVAHFILSKSGATSSATNHCMVRGEGSMAKTLLRNRLANHVEVQWHHETPVYVRQAMPPKWSFLPMYMCHFSSATVVALKRKRKSGSLRAVPPPDSM